MKTRLVLAILFLAAAASARRIPYGAVDCDVNPDEATVYVNGQALGPAADFDGWPGYLYLKAGSYELEFRLPGYETYRVKVQVKPYDLVRIEYTLNKGESTQNEEETGVEENRPKTEPSAVRAGAKLDLKLSPENAVSYLDGRLLATADDLARMHGPLQIDAGHHIIACYAPGYEEDSKEFTIAPGEYLEMNVVLHQK